MRIIDKELKIDHSNENSTEMTPRIVTDAEVQIGKHTFCCSWAISNCRYGINMGTPWHEQNQVRANYATQSLTVNGRFILVPKTLNNGLKISNMSAKKWKKGHQSNLQVYSVNEINNIKRSTVSSVSPISAYYLEAKDKITEKYSSIFRDDLPAGLPLAQEVDHEIKTLNDAKPPHKTLFHLSPSELLATKEYITELLKKGKIRPRRSLYGASLFFITQNGSLRGVIDYQALNRITKRNGAPIPRTDEMFDRLGKAKVYSKLDLKAGFHQIRVKNKDIEKRAFRTKYGHYEFLVMPMGLCNAPVTFQSLMNSIFEDDVDVFLVVYLDDLLVYSDSYENHLKHLELGLSRLQDNQLYVGKSKCKVMTTNTEFLGLQLGVHGIEVGEDRKKIVQEWPRPNNLSELRRIIGLLQFSRRFIKKFSHLVAPLTDLIRKGCGIHRGYE